MSYPLTIKIKPRQIVPGRVAFQGKHWQSSYEWMEANAEEIIKMLEAAEGGVVIFTVDILEEQDNERND